MTEGDSAPDRALSVVAGGVAWKLATQLVAYGSRAVITVVLARLLTPEDFGVAGLALLFSALVLVFTDLGAALVHRQDLREEDLSTAFWLSITSGAVLTLATIALAGPISELFREPEVKPLLIALSFAFMLTAAITTPAGLLTRRLAFRQIELSNLTAVLVAAAAAVVVAVMGGGAWAIIAQQITQSVVYFILIWSISRWRPRFMFSRASARSLGGYSINLMGAKLFDYVQSNSDNILIGRFLGPTALGVYSMAYNLMLYPVVRLSDPVNAAMFPVISRMQDDNERMAGVWLRVSRFMAVAVTPAMLLLIVLAPEFVSLVLGDRWDEAVPVLQVLSWAGLVQAVRGPTSAVLLAKGLTGRFFSYNVLSAIVLIIGFALTVQFGVVEVAISYSVAMTLLSPLFVRMGTRAIGIRMSRYFANLGGVAIAAIALTLVGFALRHLLVAAGFGDLAVFGCVIVAGVAVYGLVCWWRMPSLVDDARTLIGMMRRRRAGTSEGETG